MAGFVVVGAGLAGASAAIALRKYSVDARVTLIGEEDEAPYERPPLSKGYLRGSSRRSTSLNAAASGSTTALSSISSVRQVSAAFTLPVTSPGIFIRSSGVTFGSSTGRTLPYHDVPWFWSDQYDANIQYAGHHTSYEELIVRGQLDGGSYAAFYINGGVIDAVVGINNARDVRRAMPLIKARHPVDPGKLRDETVDLRSLIQAPTISR